MVGSFRYEFALIGLILIIFSGIVLANTSVLPNLFNINEDAQKFFNITVNNTGAGQNITQVNITLPSGFTYSTETANTSGTATISASGSVISWTNDGAGAHLILNNSWKFFWFNATADNPGSYNFTIVTLYSNGLTNYTNLSVNVNDTTAPVLTINSPITNSSSASVNFNVTINENGSSCRFSINGATNVTMQNSGNFSFNYTNASISDGLYNASFYCNDTSGNNGTAATIFLVDTLKPQIDFGYGVQSDLANVAVDWIYANVSVNESNFKNITFFLFKDGVSVRSDAYTTLVLAVNWTSLANGNYSYNVSVYDNAGNFNVTSLRRINISVSSSDSSSTSTNSQITMVSKKKFNWAKLNAGAETIARVETYGIWQIKLMTINPASNVVLEVIKLDGKPSSISKSPGVRTYKYIEINVTKLTSLDSATIQFMVETQWLKDRNITADKMLAYRYDEDSESWVSLKTSIIGNDSLYYYLDALTNHFSVFAIAETNLSTGSTTNNISTGSNTASSQNSSETVKTTTNEEGGGSLWVWIIVFISIIFVGGAVGAFIWIKKNKDLGRKVWVRRGASERNEVKKEQKKEVKNDTFWQNWKNWIKKK